MSSIQTTHRTTAQAGDIQALPGAPIDTTPALPGSLIMLLAAGAGLSVAALYYSQPMLGIMGLDIDASDRQVGLIPTLTQLGYAAGILFLAPLGDRYDRRTIIAIKAGILTLALLLSGMASGVAMLWVTSLAIGLSATMAQDIVPAAATLAPVAHRGKIVGQVMTGLLLGILLSRVVSGLGGEQFGWRAVYVAAAVSVALIGLTAWRRLPRFAATTALSYHDLLVSMIQLWRKYEPLRRAAASQALLSIGFSAFWSTLAVMLHAAPFHLGSAAAGAFGLAGAAGALAAPIVGKVVDRHGPERVTRLGAGLAAISFAAMALAPWMSPSMQLVLIALAAIGFDFGVQASLIAHQTIVYGIEPAARSRLNALLFTSMFIGMAVGAGLGSLALSAWGWLGVVVLATASAIAALAVRLLRR